MRLTVNGEPADVPEGATVADLVRRLELRSEQVAVEVNRQVVRRGDHATVVLAPGDVVELVTLVGGG